MNTLKTHQQSQDQQDQSKEDSPKLQQGTPPSQEKSTASGSQHNRYDFSSSEEDELEVDADDDLYQESLDVTMELPEMLPHDILDDYKQRLKKQQMPPCEVQQRQMEDDPDLLDDSLDDVGME